MNNESVDISAEMGYNSPNDENVTIVKMDEQAPINDIECTHAVLVPDPDDTMGDAIYHGCANRKCGLGWYIKSA
jgi:hypothetical protein